MTKGKKTHKRAMLVAGILNKPTRIKATTATCIDNILTNNENIIQSTILVNDTSDHMPTILSTNLDFINPKKHNKKFIFKRNHCDVNIKTFEKRLSEVKWQEVLDNNDVNDDYDKFIERFNEIYDECIPLKNVLLIGKKILCHHGSLKVC